MKTLVTVWLRMFLPGRRLSALVGDGPPIYTLWIDDLSGHKDFFLRALSTFLVARDISFRIVFLRVGCDVQNFVAGFLEGQNVGSRFTFSTTNFFALARNSLKDETTGESQHSNVVLDGDHSFPLFVFAKVPRARFLIARPLTRGLNQTSWLRSIKAKLISWARLRGFIFLSLLNPWAESPEGYFPVRDPSPFLLINPPARTSLKKRSTRALVVGVFGLIDKRKNLPLLVESCSHVENCHLKVQGRWASERQVRRLARLAQRLSVQLSIENKALSDVELATKMQEVDVVAVLNSNEGSSGIALGALHLGLPLLLGGSDSLRVFSRAGGTLWGGNSCGQIADALRRFRDQPEIRDQVISRPHDLLPSLEAFSLSVLGESNSHGLPQGF